MKKWLNAYFGFSGKEFNGLMALIALMGLTMLLPYVYEWVKKEEPITEAEKLAVLKLAAAEQKRISVYHQLNFPAKAKDNHKTELFTFDPNVIGQADWVRLGLSAKQASAILNYLKKGGKFREADDLRKMYTINEVLCEKLIPFVKIPEPIVKEPANFKQVFAEKDRYRKTRVFIELNDADTVDLDQVKGIGMSFANRIIKYRDRLGGFHNIAQLKEVFGIDSVKYNEIRGQIWADPSKLRKINVNVAQFEDFKNHPYIRYKQVMALIAYREQHGNYSNIADLNKVVILNEETLSRLAAYLEF